jgi:small ligand-binding sensory domain FIST
MQRFLAGHSRSKDTDQLVSECLEQLGHIPSEANHGFLYATDELSAELPAIFATLQSRTGITNWVGSLGAGISTTGHEIYDQPALAIMLADFPEASFCSIPSQKLGIESFLAENRDWVETGSMHFGILHGDPTNPATPQLMEHLATGVPGAFLVGGLTSSDSKYFQVANGLTTGGISGVLFSSEIPVATSHTQGCTPISSKHVITQCQQNILIELDDRPALDVFKEDIGEVLAKDLNRVAGYIFVGFPVLGSDTGDYMVRNLVGIDPKQKLIAVGEYLSHGQEIMFCRRDGNTAREDMSRMLADIHKRLPDSPKGAIYISCLGRGRYLFGEHSEELKCIQHELGDLPLVGFFANGEIYHNRLYGYTGVLTVFC